MSIARERWGPLYPCGSNETFFVLSLNACLRILTAL